MESIVNKEAPAKVTQHRQAIPAVHMNQVAVKKPIVKPSVFKKESLTGMRETAATVREIKLAAQRELELARKMRDDAARYQQQMATRARSDAQQLILKVRLATQRETEELVRQANEEIQKVLADIRMIRIMAQEELAAQRKFTDAARLRTLSDGIEVVEPRPDTRKNKPLAVVK